MMLLAGDLVEGEQQPMTRSLWSENKKSRNTYSYGRMRSQYSENCLGQRGFYEGMRKVIAGRRNVTDCALAVIDYMASG